MQNCAIIVRMNLIWEDHYGYNETLIFTKSIC